MVRKVKETVDTEINVCTTITCDRLDKRADSKFCPSCGCPIEPKVFKEETTSDVWDLLGTDEFENEMYIVHNGGTDMSNEWDIVIPNHTMPGEIDLEDAGWAEVKPERIERELKWMMLRYAKLLVYLLAKYGKDNVVCQWGIIKHYN